MLLGFCEQSILNTFGVLGILKLFLGGGLPLLPEGIFLVLSSLGCDELLNACSLSVNSSLGSGGGLLEWSENLLGSSSAISTSGSGYESIDEILGGNLGGEVGSTVGLVVVGGFLGIVSGLNKVLIAL